MLIFQKIPRFNLVYEEGFSRIVFTSLDNTQAGSWGQIVFTETSTDSILDYVVIRYGGTKWGGSWPGPRPDYVLRIEGGDLTLNEDNLTFENNTGDILDLRPEKEGGGG